MSLYIVPFVASFLLSVALLALAVFSSGKFLPKIRDEKGRLHKRISRFGGIALILTFLAVVVMDAHLSVTPQLLGLLVGAILVLIVGSWDDLVPLPWGAQLLFQVALGSLIFLFGMRAWVVTNPFGEPIFLRPEEWIFPSFLIGLLWTVLVMNAVNWADGVDGLLGGVSAVAFSTIFLVALRPDVNQPTVAILAAISVGLSLGFLMFNIPPARIIAGTAGSFFVGFLITALSLFAGAKIATALLVLSVPVLDAIFVIRGRIRAGVSPFRGGDSRHLHDRLREIGWSDRRIALSYTAVSAVAAIAALSLPALGKLFFLVALSLAFIFFVAAVERKLGHRPNACKV
jgi:UDP-GlcNAc:undecaprenyl-phosphate GlcNAc-1-phosphate transferase